MGLARGRKRPASAVLAACQRPLAGAPLRALGAARLGGAGATREPFRGRGVRRADGPAAAHGRGVAACGGAPGVSERAGLGMAARPLRALSWLFARPLPRLFAALVPHALGIARRRAGHRRVVEASRLPQFLPAAPARSVRRFPHCGSGLANQPPVIDMKRRTLCGASRNSWRSGLRLMAWTI